MNFDGFGNSDNTGNGFSYNNPHTEAFFITPEFRYLFVGDHMAGSYIAPFFKYTNMSYTADYSTNYYPTTYNDRLTFNYQTLGIGICIGQQFIYKNRISLDVFAGPVYNMLLAKTTPQMLTIIPLAKFKLIITFQI